MKKEVKVCTQKDTVPETFQPCSDYKPEVVYVTGVYTYTTK